MRGNTISKTFYAQTSAYVAVSFTATLSSLIDGIIIGQFLGVDSIAAFGIVNPLLVVLALIGAVVSVGARGRFVVLLGKGKLKEAQNVFSLACVISALTAAVTAVTVIVFATPLTRLLGASGNAAALLPKARAYMIGVAIGIPARNVMWVMQAFLPIDNDRRLPVIASAVMAVVNILLDLAVVFFFNGDTFEMGLVTSVSQIAALLVYFTHFSGKDAFLKLSFGNISWADTRETLSEGIPAGTHSTGHMLRGVFMNRILAVIASSTAIAAYSVYGQAETLLIPLTAGMADAVSVLSGMLSGEENRPMIKKLLGEAFGATCTFTLGISVLCFALAPTFASCFIRGNGGAFKMAVRAVRAYAVGMPVYGLNMIYQDYLHGIGKAGLSALSGFLIEFGFPVGAAAVMTAGFGADAVWYAFPAAQILVLIYYAALTAVENKRLGINKKGVLDRLLLFGDSFDVADSDRMDRCVTTMEEVSSLSQEVWRFCDEHGCDDRRKYLMSLSVEEMAGNIIKHGFSKDNKPHSADVRILHKGDDYIIRIRDNCRIFNPLERLKLYSDDDSAHHIGLRMIIGMAKTVRYTSVFRLNNLFIKV